MDDDYELLDLDDGRKLERFGTVTVARPAPAARGPHRAERSLWESADGWYADGAWSFRRDPPDPWIVESAGVRLALEPRPSGQVGLFPEQEGRRRRMAENLRGATGEPPRVLDLFAYTGGSTLVAAAAGAAVTHVDAARGITETARRNAALNGLEKAPIRWITDDVARFVARELRRRSRYDAIVLDPPTFGRGPQGEVWKIEKHLDDLLRECAELLSDRARFVALTAHTESWTAEGLAGRLDRALTGRGGVTESGALRLEAASGATLPAGLFAWRDLGG